MAYFASDHQFRHLWCETSVWPHANMPFDALTQLSSRLYECEAKWLLLNWTYTIMRSADIRACAERSLHCWSVAVCMLNNADPYVQSVNCVWWKQMRNHIRPLLLVWTHGAAWDRNTITDEGAETTASLVTWRNARGPNWEASPSDGFSRPVVCLSATRPPRAHIKYSSAPFTTSWTLQETHTQKHKTACVSAISLQYITVKLHIIQVHRC